MKTSTRFLIFRWAIYCIATVQFLRVYIYATIPYLNLRSYLAGHERLPFQERVLPIFIMDLFYRSHWIMRHLTHPHGFFSVEDGPLFFISLASFAVACFFIHKLYYQLSPNRTFEVLLYPLFLYCVMMTYSGHIEQNYRYPYDFPSLAFFTAGLYFIYMDRFLFLAVVMLLGTMNRETTLFLIGIYVLHATHVGDAKTSILKRYDLTKIPWLRALFLTSIWLAIKVTVAHIFRNNDRSEDHLRIKDNLLLIRPQFIPELLNVCGYLLPVVWILRKKIRPARFAAYTDILPFWLAVMFCTGLIVEVRVYGELTSYVAIASVLLLEQHVAVRSQLPTSGDRS